MTIRRAVAWIVAAFVFICGIQVLYWPVILVPGTPLWWWQNGALARIGRVVAFVPYAVTVWLGLYLSGLLLEVIGFLLNLIWSAAVYWVLARLLLPGKSRN